MWENTSVLTGDFSATLASAAAAWLTTCDSESNTGNAGTSLRLTHAAFLHFFFLLF